MTVVSITFSPINQLLYYLRELQPNKLMAQPCISEAFTALKARHPEKFLPIDTTHEEVFKAYLENVVDPEMRQYVDINDQIPCSKEILENLLHCFMFGKKTIRFYVCQLMRGGHEGGIAYKVEEQILHLSFAPIIYFDNDVSGCFTVSEITPEINDYAFVLRTSKTRDGEIGAGHMMLVEYHDNLVNQLMVGLPSTGLK